MPELMIDFITSVDGYGAAEGRPGFWGLEGPEYLAWLGDQPEGAASLLPESGPSIKTRRNRRAIQAQEPLARASVLP
jgi:hypothetical protein